MPIRFDAISDRLERSSGVIDYNAAYCWMGWFYVAVDSNAITGFALIDDATANNRDWMSTTNTGTLLRNHVTVGGAATNVNGTDLTVGQWYHIAMVRETATSLKLYLDGVLDSTNTANVAARVASTHMEIASRNSGAANNLNGRVYAMKAWTASLTPAEVQQERLVMRPVRLANLYGFWPVRPGSGERTRDYSGNGRDWTEGGTLTDEDPSSVSYGAPRGQRIFVAPAVRAYGALSFAVAGGGVLSMANLGGGQSSMAPLTGGLATEE